MSAPPPTRVDGSMSLLVDMTAAALDPAYADATARKTAERRTPGAGDVPEQPRGRSLVAAVLVLAGLVTGVAAAQVRRDADRVNELRASLADDVRTQTRATDRLAAQAAALRAEVAKVRASALGEDERGRAAAEQLASLELLAGSVAVHGPGIVVTVDDAKDDAKDAAGGTAQRGGQLGDGRIYDRDLQDVVNALWLAGAEAVSVNGQRVTSQTAIRSAGEAVLVDFRPLTPPYVLRAVGDVDALEPRFAQDPVAARLQTWTSAYGIGFSIRRAHDLSLPAAADPELRSARSEVTP